MAHCSCCISYSNVGSDHLPTKPLCSSLISEISSSRRGGFGWLLCNTYDQHDFVQFVYSCSEQTAKSIRSLIRIAGTIIVIAVVISYLSQNPVIAVSISTISGLVIGFAASNLIGNVIAGIYLAITRPFRICDRIKVFNGDGRVSDIGLLYTRLLLDNGDEMLASNSSMVTTNIILRKKVRENQE